MLDIKALLTKMLNWIYNQRYQANNYTTNQGNITVYKRSGVVTITFRSLKNMNANTFYTMTTLPTAYRPSSACYFVVRHPTDAFRLRVTVNADGTLTVYSYGTAVPNTDANNIVQTISYVVAS